ncbi:ATP-dependent zinc metalloprotease FtsH [Gemmata obscuriglobus]|uniref:ATP-dependent zinc metalloprotease FtsH n=2 Tax=Gemmata obscuriglobus TaxID=114 RepID=A0A2Z3H8A4_9BACT|nr:ATP-dependent zinc metalloprotease FtsH [Gemmata obscuriglobus]
MDSGQLKSVTLLGPDRAEGEVRDPDSAAAKKLELGKTGRFAVNLPHSNDQRPLTAEIEKADQKYREELKKAAPSQAEPERVVINRRDEPTPWLGPLLLQLLIVFGLVMVFVVFFLPRLRDPMGGGFINNYIRSPAKRYEKGKGRVTFEDVAGMESAKRELTEMVDYLKDPAKFTRVGATVPKGVLLVGPPGTGKTLLAKAVAGEANVPFFAISGSEFIQMFVGVGASRVRDMFRTAKEHSPCVIFIDEIDAVGRMRGAGYGGGSDEREQTLNQILSEMDGFQPSETVIVMAATNRPDVLDAALLRPGRFDRHITVDRQSWKGRLEILKVHTRNKPLSDKADLERIARSMVGMSGAELKNLCNEAALLAVRAGRNKIEQIDFDRAADRVRLGSQREEPYSDKEKRRTAYHEAGHALCAYLMPSGMQALDRVSIIPRGRAGGVTMFQQDEERVDYSQSELSAMLVMSMGGRAADKLVLGEPLSGAVGDLKQATRVARVMVTQFGMSDRVGPVYHQQGEEHVFLGKEITESRAYSEGTARLIDEEIQRILSDAENRATELVKTHRDKLDLLADALLLHEEIDRAEVEKLMNGVSVADLRPETPKPVAAAPVPQPEPTITPEVPPKPGLAFGGA